MIRKRLSELSSRTKTINRNSRGAHWPSPVKEPSSKELQWKWSESESHSVVSNSLRPHGLYTVHEILHARILEWVVHSRGSSQPRDQTQVYPHCRQILYQLSHKGSPRILKWVAYPLSSGSSDPGIKQGFPALQADSLPTELWGTPLAVQWTVLILQVVKLIGTELETWT